MKKKEGMIKYALHNITGEPVFIRDAKNGLACNSKCFECEGTMVAVQPRSESNRVWFYRHKAEDSTCGGGPMTALHAMTQQIILNHSEIITPHGCLQYTYAKKEVTLSDMRPDVTVSTEHGPVHFEVEVENPLSPEHVQRYKQGEHRCIAIDLTKVDREISPEDLKRLVLDEIENKRSVFWEPEPEPVPIAPVVNRSDDTLEKVFVFAILFFLFRGLFRLR